MGQWCARSIQTGPGSWCVQREACPTARRSVQCWPRTDNGLRGGIQNEWNDPRCCGFCVKRLLLQIIHTKLKAATDFHSKGGEIQNDVCELTGPAYAILPEWWNWTATMRSSFWCVTE